MSDFWELEFVELANETAADFLLNMVSFGDEVNNISYSCGDELNYPKFNSFREEFSFFMSDGRNQAIHFKVLKFRLSTMWIENIFIHLYKIDEENVVCIDVDSEKISLENREELIENMYDFAKTAAEKYCIDLYYAGYESAVDENTRFFTNESWGPLIWDFELNQFKD